MNDKNEINVLDELNKGACMGIIEGRKLLNHKNTDEKINSLVQKYVNMQEKAVEKLKTFL